MKRVFLALVFVVSLLCPKADAQMGITFFPGPGMPAVSGGCTMNGTLVLTNTCNNIYYFMGTV